MSMPISKEEYLKQYRTAQEKAVAYVKEVGGVEVWNALYNATMIQKLPPHEAAHHTCKNNPDMWGPFARACELASEWIWQQHPIGSAAGNLVNMVNSDFSVNK